jgi:hypothetical protein
MPLQHGVVKERLKRYFDSLGIDNQPEYMLFNHTDDKGEKSFTIDFVTHPLAEKGERGEAAFARDINSFQSFRNQIDGSIHQLRELSLFPGREGIPGWQPMANTNPMVGIAIEIENNLESKYFLGSLLAAAVAGIWGIIVVENGGYSALWVQTLKRMIHKGHQSPIPLNILVLDWQALDQHISTVLSSPLETVGHRTVMGGSGSPDTPSSPHPRGG